MFGLVGRDSSQAFTCLFFVYYVSPGAERLNSADHAFPTSRATTQLIFLCGVPVCRSYFFFYDAVAVSVPYTFSAPQQQLKYTYKNEFEMGKLNECLRSRV
jgi:hypothetical protein